jgi:hypothetical protein
MITIYCLSSSEDNIVKYIGQTKKDLRSRLYSHLYEAQHPHFSVSYDGHKSRWIRRCLENGFEILIAEIETTTTELADIREKYWISFYGRKNLVNGTDGGKDIMPEHRRRRKMPDYIYLPKVMRYLKENIREALLNKYITIYGLHNYKAVFDEDEVETLYEEYLSNLKAFLKKRPDDFSVEYGLGLFKHVCYIPKSRKEFLKYLDEIFEEYSV